MGNYDYFSPTFFKIYYHWNRKCNIGRASNVSRCYTHEKYKRARDLYSYIDFHLIMIYHLLKWLWMYNIYLLKW